ncbi:MAG: response regulator transcription factor [Dehalococcoidia bacterium]|nr:response regulator transcription factor [Dehalococcoidia bacterium]
MDVVRVLIVNANLVIRVGLRSILRSAHGIAVVGEAATGAEAIAWMRKSSADVVLMDTRLPIIGGVTATSEIMRIRPETKILMLAVMDDPYPLAESILAGAKGCFVHHGASPEDLLESIYSVGSGKSIPLPPSVELALADLRGSSPADHLSQGERVDNYLTIRQIEILELLRKGKSNREIGRMLHIEEKTVKNHLRTIYGRLGINNRFEAIKLRLRAVP